MKLQPIIENIYNKAAKIDRPIRLMELCGTHAEMIAKNGIKSLLPKNIQLISGPGCPVCVTDQEEIDVIVGLAKNGIPVATYGDAVGVPGNSGSLEEARQQGADVNIVYDISQALEISQEKPDLIFWGLGFETTAIATAWAVGQGLKVFSSHKLFPPAMEMLLASKDIKVDGFINPGHVSAIIGTAPYEKFSIPQVVAGFEAVDVLLAVDMLLDQIVSGRYEVRNEYSRLVKKEGNKKALKLITDIFMTSDSKWRGLGTIKNSGLKLRKKYEEQDAEHIHKKLITRIKKDIKIKPSACRCGDVLIGRIEPKGCPLFGKICTPNKPRGACMVSQEGSCNIEYRFSEQ